MTAPPTSSERAPVLPEHPPRPQLSFVRILFALVLIAAIAAGAAYAIQRHSVRTVAAATPRYAPYVDVTLTPTYAFQSPTANPVQRVVLGFVVANGSHSCAPSWGGYYTPAQAESTLNLDQRVEQVDAQGGVATISFGGEANTELAVACTNVNKLAAAYQDVVDRYGVHGIDFDIEGTSVYDSAANKRRAQAVAIVQKRIAKAGGQLSVWLTLPVATDGLTTGGVATVRSMLTGGVALTGVNALAMDFDPTTAVQKNMIGAVESSLTHTHGQLAAIDAQARIDSASAAVWGHVGVTVMVGRNDPAGEVFSLADASALARFVEAHGVAQVSIWSLNRDSECGSVFAETDVLSNTCSGVKQTPLQFTDTFSKLPGTVTAEPQVSSPLRASPSAQTDDPATSPYPVWRPDAAYPRDYKVVWHHAVYQALWFAQGQVPDAPVTGAGQSPWLLLGPVLAGESPPKPILLDHGVHAQWSAKAVYRAGARVLYSGLPFEARYYSQGVAPETSLPADASSPWTPLFTTPGEPSS